MQVGLRLVRLRRNTLTRPGQFLGIVGTEEEPTNSLHAFHVAGSLAWRMRRAGRRRSRRESLFDV
jgi:hypothetical protein